MLLGLETNRSTAATIINEVVWKKDKILVGKTEGQNVTTCANYSKRCLVFNNGSLSLCPTLIGDVGQYTVETFTKDQVQLYNLTIQLELTRKYPLGPSPSLYLASGPLP